MAKKGQGRTILVADDEPEVVDLVKIVLELEGYTIESASDGKAALAKIQAKLPDLVLLDMRMPEMTGLMVLDQLRSDPATASIPVIMLSVVVTDPDIRMALEHGAVSYLSKPFEIRELTWVINRVLAMDAAGRDNFRKQVLLNVGRRS
jgi:CheY-like chemotaxis protein